MYEDEFELTFDTPEEEPVYEPEKASAAPAPVPETTPAEIVPDEPTRVLEPRRAAPAEPAEPTPVSEPEPAEEPQPQSAAVPANGITPEEIQTCKDIAQKLGVTLRIRSFIDS